MKRREFITILAGTAAWPLAARAEQPAIPVIGFLSFRSANESAASEASFRQGLSEIGYAEGRNVHIAFRWAEGQSDRLPALAADLVDNLHVAVIAAVGGGPSILAAKAATKTIPIVFTYGADPVKAGIVASLSKPEQNITGITWFSGDLTGKRLALLHDVVPNIATIGLLHDPSVPETRSEPADAQDAGRRLNLKVLVLNASTETQPFSWRRNLPPLLAKKTIFNYVATYNDFERRFAQFLDEKAGDVLRFAALGTTEQGESGAQFRVDYLKPSGAIGFYHPDWVVVQKTKAGEVNWIIETKGRVWEGTTAKDEAIREWCERVSEATGADWRYMRVDQTRFDSSGANTLGNLVDDLSRA